MSEQRGAIFTLSESSPVRLGLVLVLIGFVWWFSQTLSAINGKIDLQGERMETQRVLIETLSRDVRDLSQRVRDLERKEVK